MLRTLPCILALSLAVSAQDDVQRAKAALERVLAADELKPLAEEPEWAAQDGAPIFRFVQFTDIHHVDGPHDGNLERAIGFVNATLKPDWVVVTGDNISPPQTEEHEREVKTLLEGLACPYYMLKGNHDEQVYEAVFGSSRWSFDCGGVHFLGATLDYDTREEGIGYLDASTYRWMRKDVAAHSSQPMVYFMHENLVPPDFVDAARLGVVLSLHRNLVATVTGHLHHDVEQRVGRVTHVICPALGPSARHGIKLYEAHEGHITVKTYEVVGGKYAFANKWQRIAFPAGLRADASKGKAVTEYAAAAPLPTTTTNGLSALDVAGRDLIGRLYRIFSGGK